MNSLSSQKPKIIIVKNNLKNLHMRVGNLTPNKLPTIQWVCMPNRFFCILNVVGNPILRESGYNDSLKILANVTIVTQACRGFVPTWVRGWPSHSQLGRMRGSQVCLTRGWPHLSGWARAGLVPVRPFGRVLCALLGMLHQPYSSNCGRNDCPNRYAQAQSISVAFSQAGLYQLSSSAMS